MSENETEAAIETTATTASGPEQDAVVLDITGSEATLVAEAASAPSPSAVEEAIRAIEAMVMVAIDPVEEQVLAQLLELPVVVVHQLCVDLAASYETQARGFEMAHVAGGWRFQSHPDMAPYIERYVLEGQSARLSSAALETLAIVAYKQPISRAQVSAIRGVNVDGVLRTLTQRGYVDEIGRDLGPGQATLFGTTDDFLERLGLGSLDDLPPLGDFVPSADIVEALEQTLRVSEDSISEEASTSEVASASEVASTSEVASSSEQEAVAEVGASEAGASATPFE